MSNILLVYANFMIRIQGAMQETLDSLGFTADKRIIQHWADRHGFVTCNWDELLPPAKHGGDTWCRRQKSLFVSKDYHHYDKEVLCIRLTTSKYGPSGEIDDHERVLVSQMHVPMETNEQKESALSQIVLMIKSV